MYRDNSELKEVTYSALRTLYVLSSTENIIAEITKLDGIEQLIECIESKTCSAEAQRMAAKIIYNIYSEVSFTVT